MTNESVTRSIDSSSPFRNTAVVLLSLGIALFTAGAAAQSEAGPTNAQDVAPAVSRDLDRTVPRTNENGSSESFAAALWNRPWGVGASMVLHDPTGSYASDHGSVKGTGASLQMLIRWSKSWTFAPTISGATSTPGPSEKSRLLFGAKLKEVQHRTGTYGLEVQWRGPNPGAAYLLAGAGKAKVALETEQTQCSWLPTISCSTSTTTIASKTAPFGLLGFGLESGSGFSEYGQGGWFVEVRLWRGPYLHLVPSASGSSLEARAATGNAVQLVLGGRLN